VTEVDLAARIAPGRPLAGRLAQLAIGGAGCLPAALVARPLPGAALGLVAGMAAARAHRRPLDRALALAAHAAGGTVAAAAARGPTPSG
jgi:hypothetical protein